MGGDVSQHQEQLSHLQGELEWTSKSVKKMVEKVKKVAGKDGTLTREQFTKVMKSIFKNSKKGEINERYLDYYFNAFDRDNSNSIDPKELLLSVAFFFTEPTIDEQLDISFRCWDINSDGKVSKEELKEILVTNKCIGKSIGKNKIIGKVKKGGLEPEEMAEIEADVDAIFAEIDTNQDGFISYDEFIFNALSGSQGMRDKINEVMFGKCVRSDLQA